MKMSQKRRSALYGAIHAVVTDTRIALQKHGVSPQVDALVAQAEHVLWRRVLAALNVPEKP